MNGDVDETRKAYEAALMRPLPFGDDLWVKVRIAEPLVLAQLERITVLEAALTGLLTTVRANCLDVLEQEAQRYTGMGYPRLDVRAKAVYAEVTAAVEMAEKALGINAASAQEGQS